MWKDIFRLEFPAIYGKELNILTCGKNIISSILLKNSLEFNFCTRGGLLQDMDIKEQFLHACFMLTDVESPLL